MMNSEGIECHVYGKCRRVSPAIVQKYYKDQEGGVPSMDLILDSFHNIPGPTDGGVPGFGHAEQYLTLSLIREGGDSPTLREKLSDFISRLPPGQDFTGDRDNPLAWYVAACKAKGVPLIPEKSPPLLK